MNKSLIISMSLLLLAANMSCKRTHLCYCKVSGTLDTTLIKEYRGYSKKEARQLCKTDELASTHSVDIVCDINK